MLELHMYKIFLQFFSVQRSKGTKQQKEILDKQLGLLKSDSVFNLLRVGSPIHTPRPQPQQLS